MAENVPIYRNNMVQETFFLFYTTCASSSSAFSFEATHGSSIEEEREFEIVCCLSGDVFISAVARNKHQHRDDDDDDDDIISVLVLAKRMMRAGTDPEEQCGSQCL